MKNKKLIISIFLIGMFLGFLLWFPSFILFRLAPEGVNCKKSSGTLWQGQCVGLHIHELTADYFYWKIRPLKLLSGNISGEISFTGKTNINKLKNFLPSLNSLDDTTGYIYFKIESLKFTNKNIENILGSITVKELTIKRVSSESIGDFELVFQPATKVGVLRDITSPLQISGTVELTNALSYMLKISIKSRDNQFRPYEIIHTANWL